MRSPTLSALLVFLRLLLPLGAEQKEIVIAAYNVENYVAAHPKEPGQKYATRAKSEKAMESVIRVI